jgi:hypothetical protein
LNPLADTPLLHFEQNVNDRRRTSSAPAIDPALLPEAGGSRPLAWRRVDRSATELFLSGDPRAASAAEQMMDGGSIYLPVHPLAEHRYEGDGLVRSGQIRISASYRTVFFEPERNGLFDRWVPPDQVLMIKLHLDEPLPGIPGDRRLTRDKIEKCVLLSDALGAAVADDPLAERLTIVPEFLGAAHPDGGVLLRLLPERGLLPAFSLHSKDSTRSGDPSLIVRRLDALYGDDRGRAADALGDELAAPLVRGMLAGLRAGFSLEMHAQNTLLELGSERLIERVYFRDLEGVVFSDRFRRARGLEALFPASDNAELTWSGRSMRRWYNRNLDHDIGRILHSTLEALDDSSYFDRSDMKRARRSIRRAVREAVSLAGLAAFHWPGRWLPFTRSPYGNGTRLGHYYRSRFR